MEITSELPYWMAISHIRNWRRERINNLIVEIYKEKQKTLIDFFNDFSGFDIADKELAMLNEAKNELQNYAFLAEDMQNQGYEIITLNSSDYPQSLKDNLKLKGCPTLLYIKGNKIILEEDKIAVVGSRDASEKALKFTDDVVRLLSKKWKVIVSGFAKGVDRQSLDSAINYIGHSIIVLPQGIMTFDWGMKKYYKQIIADDVLVLSTFPPKVTWSVQNAMARNPIIYGLADDIYVAESGSEGGTWYGVMDGLKRNRVIYVRKPDPDENNANNLLIEKGAIPVVCDGNEIIIEKKEEKGFTSELIIPEKKTISEADYLKQVMELLEKGGAFTSSEIIKKLELNINPIKLTVLLKNQKNIELIKGKPVKFKKVEQSLF